MRASADRFHNALNAAGVPHSYWMYGRPGFGCDGGHNFGCWNFALNDAMPGMMAALGAGAPPPPPPPRPPRQCRTATLRALDWGRGCARATAAPITEPAWREPEPATAGCATTRASTISTRRSASPQNTTYSVSAWIRTSANNNAGYLGLRTPGGQVVGEQSFQRLDDYTKVTATREQRLEHEPRRLRRPLGERRRHLGADRRRDGHAVGARARRRLGGRRRAQIPSAALRE